MPETRQANSPATLIATKISVPLLRVAVVRRPRLIEKLESAAVRLILVSASAGFGKTTLVLDWLRQTGRCVAWVSLDEADSNPRRFMTCLLSAIQRIHPGIDKSITTLVFSQAFPPLEHLLALLANELGAMQKDMVIVLDDYHVIEDPQIHLALAFFIEHTPPETRVVIITRVDPLLPLPRFRVRNQLVEIRERDLRFDVDEAERFFRDTMQLHLDRGNIETLERRTEGWVAGLQLAALSLGEAVDKQVLIDSFAGSNRFIVDYLLEEVLFRQPQHIQSFLLQTSILTRFNALLCEAVTGQENAQQILDHLEKINLFLVPLDTQRQWFRYHHLFSELLRHQLTRVGTETIGELHRRASAWCEEHHDIHEAVRHAIHMETGDRTLMLLERHGLHFVLRSELATYLDFVERAGRPKLVGYPTALVALAWCQMLSSNSQELPNTLADVERSLRTPAIPYSVEQSATVRAHVQTIGAFVMKFEENGTEYIRQCEAALRSMPLAEVMLRGLLSFNLGRAYLFFGRAKDAQEMFKRAAEDGKTSGNHYNMVASIGLAGQCFLATEGYYHAETYLRAALTDVKHTGLNELAGTGYIYLQLGRVLYGKNNLAEAQIATERALQLGESGNEATILLGANLTMAMVRVALGHIEVAREHLRRAEEFERSGHIRLIAENACITKAHSAMLLPGEETSRRWAQEQNFDTRSEFTSLTELNALALARWHVGERNGTAARPLLRWLRRNYEQRRTITNLVTVDLWEALLLHSDKSETEAMNLIGRCIESARRIGHLRVFFTSGRDVAGLLSSFLAQENIPREQRDFARAIIEQLIGETETRSKGVPKFVQQLHEPLTEREQEVLHLLAQGLSNKKVADRMFISMNTLKTHIKHLYAKLGAATREDAIQRASDTRLLSIDPNTKGGKLPE